MPCCQHKVKPVSHQTDAAHTKPCCTQTADASAGIGSGCRFRKILPPEVYEVTRKKGTELACSGPFWDHHEKGTYKCVCCNLDLFTSTTKFESGTGCPSFFRPVAKENIREEVDTSFFMVRTEILCARCDAHLGHVFTDGPAPTGLRYCVNSLALKFEKSK